MVCQNLNVQLQGQRVKPNLYTLFRLFHEYSLPEGRAGVSPVFIVFAFRVKLAQSPPMLHTHLHLQVRLKKTNGRSLGTFQKVTLFFSEIGERWIEKYLHLCFTDSPVRIVPPMLYTPSICCSYHKDERVTFGNLPEAMLFRNWEATDKEILSLILHKGFISIPISLDYKALINHFYISM